MNGPEPRRPVVAVVGGGISGLVAARRLARSGARVVLVEAGERLGGQVHTRDFAGLRVDVGAEALHLAAPPLAALVAELGLEDEIVAARAGGSLLWTARGARPLPAGVGPAGPTQLRPLLTSRTMTPLGVLRAALEPAVAAARGGLDLSPGHDVSVGEFLTSRFGAQVTERLVDPLLGSLHSGDVDRLSLRACAPALVPAAAGGRSLVPRPGRRSGSPGGPRVPMARLPGRPWVRRHAGRNATEPPTGGPAAFASFTGGLSTLTGALLAGLDVDMRLQTAGRALAPREAGLVLHVGPAGDGFSPTAEIDVDAVVLAVPAPAAAALLAGIAPQAAAPLRGMRVARTAVVVLAFDRADVGGVAALSRTGLLVPSAAGSLLKAATHLSTKWPHLDVARTCLVRASVGRAGSAALDGLDDATLVELVRVELRRFTGIEATPHLAHVERWDAGIPQLDVGHPDRVAAARAALARELPGVALAGASYDGIGLAACVASGQHAAAAVSPLLPLRGIVSDRDVHPVRIRGVREAHGDDAAH